MAVLKAELGGGGGGGVIELEDKALSYRSERYTVSLKLKHALSIFLSAL